MKQASITDPRNFPQINRFGFNTHVEDDLRKQQQMRPDQKQNSVKQNFYDQARKAKIKSNQKKYGLSYFHKLFHQVFTHF